MDKALTGSEFRDFGPKRRNVRPAAPQEDPNLMPISRRSVVVAKTLFLVLVVLTAVPASALLYIDFEQPYYIHPDMQVWDHCLVFHDDQYHIFYHAIPESDPYPGYSDHIWTSASPDMIHWSEPRIVLSVSEEAHEAEAMWAPDVVFDPESGLWWMSYTAVDASINQRICMAWSRDLQEWFKTRQNPVLEPDSDVFFYNPESGWAECRDPYLYHENGLWHLVASAKIQGMANGQGALSHSTSTDMLDWSPTEVFLTNDGEGPGNSLESPQYIARQGFHHIFFHEYTTSGVTHIASLNTGAWTLVNGTQIDLGIAPEVETFDGGENYMFTRIAPYQEPDRPVLSYVARIDTLKFRGGVDAPLVYRAPTLLREFEAYGGNACLGNPCFGDNPARRGEDPANIEGYWFFGSREYFQGPLSGRGDAGRLIGETAQGWVETAPFVVEGTTISLLCGGTNNPENCFVALMDAAADTVLKRVSGYGTETMTRRYWDVTPLQGVEVYLRIEDSDPFGHINVDHIVESHDVTTSVGPATLPDAGLLTDLGPRPNPFNPATVLQFELTSPADCRVRIHDLRGHLVWDSGSVAGHAGINSVSWRGIDAAGGPAPAGVYVYGIAVEGRAVTSGKLTLVP